MSGATARRIGRVGNRSDKGVQVQSPTAQPWAFPVTSMDAPRGFVQLSRRTRVAHRVTFVSPMIDPAPDFLDVPSLLARSQPRGRGAWLWYATGAFLFVVMAST